MTPPGPKLVYCLATGEILRRTIGISSPKLRPGEAIIDGDWPGEGYFVFEGQVQVLPPTPGTWAVFDAAGGTWTDPRTDEDLSQELLTAKQGAIGALLLSVETIRRQFVPDIYGQETIYLRKEAEARAFVNDPGAMSDFPFIAAEVGVTAPDAYSVAQVFLNKARVWEETAARLEAWRLRSTSEITQCEDQEALALLTKDRSLEDALRAAAGSDSS